MKSYPNGTIHGVTRDCPRKQKPKRGIPFFDILFFLLAFAVNRVVVYMSTWCSRTAPKSLATAGESFRATIMLEHRYWGTLHLSTGERCEEVLCRGAALWSTLLAKQMKANMNRVSVVSSDRSPTLIGKCS
jgi:hypothetical protein